MFTHGGWLHSATEVSGHFKQHPGFLMVDKETRLADVPQQQSACAGHAASQVWMHARMLSAARHVMTV